MRLHTDGRIQAGHARLAVALAAALLTLVVPLAARGETPAAFGRRCIPADCVAPRSHMDDMLGRRALSAGRLAALGATLDFHHGPLAASPVQPAPAAEKGDTPGQTEITRAIEAVKADPNLATERTIKTLKWRDSAAPERSPTPAWLLWIGGLFRWLGESARVLVWSAMIALAGLLVVFMTRLVQRYGDPVREEPFVAPTHVRDLDIRPESLPDDVGQAARALWDRGEHRASLALLYRGMLSRLVHVHRLPIRDSSTEGDCLALTTAHLPQEKREYSVQLVRVWQRAVYGREEVPGTAVHALCDDFAFAMSPVTQLGAMEEPA